VAPFATQLGTARAQPVVVLDERDPAGANLDSSSSSTRTGTSSPSSGIAGIDRRSATGRAVKRTASHASSTVRIRPTATTYSGRDPNAQPAT